LKAVGRYLLCPVADTKDADRAEQKNQQAGGCAEGVDRRSANGLSGIEHSRDGGATHQPRAGHGDE
jgi:hypothetical protein